MTQRSLATFLFSATALLANCGNPPPAPANELTLRIFVDGGDVIKIAGNKLWIEHGKFRPPTKIVINGEGWSPAWTDKTSDIYDKLSPEFKPTDPKKLHITKQAGRGTAVPTELPTEANGQTLSIEIDDNDFGGADWYEITVNW